MTNFSPLEILPGVVATPTKSSSSSSWRTSHLVRWDGNKLRPMGGWSEIAYTESYGAVIDSRIRKVHSWLDLSGVKYTAYLCEEKVYVDNGVALLDISPTTPLVPPYSGDVAAGGYGRGLYSEGTYGTPRADVLRENPTTPSFSIDNWGSTLLVMTSEDRRLLQWDPATPETPLTEVTDSPHGRCFVVTPERFVVIFGAGNTNNKLIWCDQEDLTDWNIADIASKAGEYLIEPAAPLLTAISSKDGVLFFSTKRTYVLRYVGLPYVYSYEDIAEAAIPISSAAISDTGRVMWMSDSGMWEFNGSVVEPMACPVWSWIKDDIDPIYSRHETIAVNISTLSEVFIFYPSNGSRYNNKYVVFNHRNNWWAMGNMGRTCGMSPSYDAYPIMCDGTHVYKHENGYSYSGAELPWVETFALNVKSGAMLSTLDQLVVDLEGDPSKVGFSVFYKTPRVEGVEKHSPVKTPRSDGYVDIRVTGRDHRIRIESLEGSARWSVGINLVGIKARGGK